MRILQSISCLALLALLVMLSIASQKEEIPQTKELPKSIVGKDGAEMVLIPAGEFQMGTDSAEIPGLVQWIQRLCPNLDVRADWFKDETPRHTVYLDAFYIDKHEVTNAQYRKFVQATGHREPEGWRIEAFDLRAANRYYYVKLEYEHGYVGFRCAGLNVTP